MSYILEDIGEFNRLEKQAKQNHYSLSNELKFLSFEGVKKVLDAGCGSGLLSRYLCEHFQKVEVFACDQSDIRLKQAKEASKSYEINYFRSSLEEIDLSSNSMDVVICRFVYEYLKDPIKVTKQFHRILKPGGVLYLIDLDGVFLNYWTTNGRLNEYLETLKNHLDLDLYVGRKLSSFLQVTGFKNIQWEASIHNFNSEIELEEEYQNSKDRILFAQEQLQEVLGGEETYLDFQKLYLQEMRSPGSTLFFNKFVTWGAKE